MKSLVASMWSFSAAIMLAAVTHAGGNVTVRVDGADNLVVTGDAADNAILVRPVDVGRGDVFGLGSTTVNGGASAAFAGVTGDFRIRMLRGDDEVRLEGGDGNRVPADLVIDLGAGADRLRVQDFTVQGALEVRSGPGDDAIELAQAVHVVGRTDIATGTGADRVLFLPAAVPDELLVFDGSFAVHAGSGRDFVGIAGALFRDEVLVDLGLGDDLGELGGVAGGLCVCGTVFEDEDVLAHVRFEGGGGADGVVLESVCGIAPPFALQDFEHGFESEPDDGSFLGGEACARSCQ